MKNRTFRQVKKWGCGIKSENWVEGFFPPNLDKNVKNYYQWKAKIIAESKYFMVKKNILKNEDFVMIIDDDRDLLAYLAEKINDQYLIFMHCEI